jgi:hypothetical protein
MGREQTKPCRPPSPAVDDVAEVVRDDGVRAALQRDEQREWIAVLLPRGAQDACGDLLGGGAPPGTVAATHLASHDGGPDRLGSAQAFAPAQVRPRFPELADACDRGGDVMPALDAPRRSGTSHVPAVVPRYAEHATPSALRGAVAQADHAPGGG